jgi:indolepyruvate decarboxylase
METKTASIGAYIGKRFEQLGLKHYFAIPGDYNLVLLDELIKNKNLTMINCCNELNAGYAADGYARAFGLSALVLTYSVGGLSAINAVAGAYAEDLPMIVVSGAPNTNSENENQRLHHTLAEVDYDYVRKAFERITAFAVTIHHLGDAPVQIDRAIEAALHTRKPVYIEVACNIAGLEISAPSKRTFDSTFRSDAGALEDALEYAANFLNAATKPVLVAGPRVRSWKAMGPFRELADASGYAVACMPNAKGFFPENHRQFIGTYWGPVSSPGCGDIVESSDAYLFAGPIFTDYATTGFSALINTSKLIHVNPHSVRVGRMTFEHVAMADFLGGLSTKIKRNETSREAYERIKGEEAMAKRHHDLNTPLTTRVLFSEIQKMLTRDMAVIAETGDSWFNSMNLKLPEGCRHEMQMQYGSIGWSVGSTLGYELGCAGAARPIAMIGDGSFQMTAQEVSTMIRYGLRPIIFLMNNGGYTIEVEIHDGPYNDIKNWNYAELMNVFNAGEGKGWGTKVTTEGELDCAIKQALGNEGPSLIECVIDRNDCNKNLLSWGSRVASNNGRAPRVL